VTFYLLEDIELALLVGEMVHNGDAENIVEFSQMFPDAWFGYICFDEVVMREFFPGFIQELRAKIETGVLD